MGIFSISCLVLNLINVTTPDGRRVEINPEEIVSVREPHGGSEHFGTGVKCLVFTADGKFVSTKETCPQILKMLDGDPILVQMAA